MLSGALQYHKMLDNSLFSVFLTSFFVTLRRLRKKLFTYWKRNKSKEKKKIKGFLQENQTKFFSVMLLFSILFFFLYHLTSPILGSILHIIWFFFYYLGNMWFIAKNCRTLGRHSRIVTLIKGCRQKAPLSRT